ncbi:MAG: integrase family protein [Betaproteobacteria bacterium]|nr:integrase family protein [Betaproteobacteria bacterium]
MARTKTSGITTDAAGNRIVCKRVDGATIFARLGAIGQDRAEAWLAEQVQRIALAKSRGSRPRVTFGEAGAKYLRDNRERLASIQDAAWHVELLYPWIGDTGLEDVHDGTLEPFVKHRLEVDKVSLTTVNRSKEVVRRILNLAARSWRHENGMTWLETSPLIAIDAKQARKKARRPYPLSWEEEDLLFAELAEDPNRQMARFKVNTGNREEEVCILRWAWEIAVPELNTSVFVIPGAFVKNGEDRLIVLNQVARKVIEERRGLHPEFVFTYRGPRAKKYGGGFRPGFAGEPIECMNNNAWQHARARAAERYRQKFGRPAPWGFEHVRVHDLKHTFGRRLRAAGVGEETRKVLHTNGDITTHYSAVELAELITAVNKIDRSLATPAITLLRARV